MSHTLTEKAQSLPIGHIIDGLGRSDLVGNYHQKQSPEFQDEKHRQRQLVMDFILPYFANDELVRAVTMPGVGWQFETMLKLQHPRCRFVGVENSKTIFLQAARMIPGDVLEDYAIRVCPYGRGNYVYARKRAITRRCSSRSQACNRIIQMSFSTYAGVLSTDYHASQSEKSKFHSKFYLRNCAWLDFTSGFCAEVNESIKLIHWPLMATRDRAIKPLVVTLMYGRDISGGIEARIKHLCTLQPRYTHKKHWLYSGKNGTPMLTLCGEIQ